MIKTVVITIHGIAYPIMEWQTFFKNVVEIKEPSIKVINFKYGFFPASLAWFGSLGMKLKIHGGFTRWYLNSLHSTYKKAIAEYPDAKVVFVAHSHGGWLLDQLVREEISVKAHKVILVSTPLHHDFTRSNFHEAMNSGRIGSIENWGCRTDMLLHGISFVPPYGDSGVSGFINITTKRVTNHIQIRGTHDSVLGSEFAKYMESLINQMRS